MLEFCLYSNTLVRLISTDEDEDGDRITVRSDEELAAMIEYVRSGDMCSKHLLHCSYSANGEYRNMAAQLCH